MNPTISHTYQHVPRFAAGSPESVGYLAEEGFVVIANALTPAGAGTALDLTWTFLEGLGTGIDRTDPSTWSDDRWPVAVHGGIVPSQGIGHSAAQWFIRSSPAVKAAFTAVWDDEDLLVSFDGMALWRPTSIDPAWRTNRGGSWLHIDQHPTGRPGRQCVQGLVSLTASSPEIGGNIVIPRSHHRFATLPETHGDRLARIPDTIDHFRFTADDPLLADTPPIMCHLEAGDMLLWDSRTIHCSSPGDDSARPDSAHLDPLDRQVQLVRAASLVCMMPRSRSNRTVIERRRRAVADRTSTTNWSDVWVNADRFPEVLAADTSRYTLPPVPRLTAEQQLMVG